MNANCIICSDLFAPKADIYTTGCGHLFHFTCLIQWIERSKTCPQCRHKESEQTIHRIYFNIQHAEHITDNVVTLQAKLDNKNFNLSLKEKDISNYSEKYMKCQANNATLRAMKTTLEATTKANKDSMRAMKAQLQYYREKLRDKEKLGQEVNRLKSHIDNMDHLKTVINGCENSVNDIVRDSSDARSLCLFVAALQKELTDQDRKTQKLSSQLRLNKSDYNQIKAQAYVVSKKCENQKKALEAHEKCPQQIAALKEKLANILLDKENVTLNASVNRVLFESPAPLRPNLDDAFVDDAQESPTIMERVTQIKTSDSPYLPIKTAVGGGYGYLLQAKYKIPKTSTPISAAKSEKYSIFNKKLEAAPTQGDYIYNGLGGHSKELVFPQPKAVSQLKNNLKGKRLNPHALSLKKK